MSRFVWLPNAAMIRLGRAATAKWQNMAAHCIVAMLCDMLAEITTGYGTILIYEIATNKHFEAPGSSAIAFREPAGVIEKQMADSIPLTASDSAFAFFLAVWLLHGLAAADVSSGACR